MDFSYIQSDDIVLVKTYQDLDREFLVNMIREAVEFSKEHETFKILFDHRNCGLKLTMIELFNAIANVKVHGLTVEYSAAIVYDLDPEKYQFSEEVINSRENPECRFFDDYDRARDWLLSKS